MDFQAIFGWIVIFSIVFGVFWIFGGSYIFRKIYHDWKKDYPKCDVCNNDLTLYEWDNSEDDHYWYESTPFKYDFLCQKHLYERVRAKSEFDKAEWQRKRDEEKERAFSNSKTAIDLRNRVAELEKIAHDHGLETK